MMADPVPKPPALDAKSMADGWSQLKRPDGTPYTAYGKWAPWKTWADSLRNYVEANRIAIKDQKGDLDAHTARLNTLNARVTALEEKPSVPFPGSG
jgi:hypothetical protein